MRIYIYKNCDTCRKALRWLDQNNLPYEAIPIREQPPTLVELKQMLRAYAGDLRRLFNTSGQDYKALGMKNKLAGLTDEAALELLSINGNLVKRPFLLLPQGGGLLGFKVDEWETALR